MSEDLIGDRLSRVVTELEAQAEAMASHDRLGLMGFQGQIEQLKEWLGPANECGLGYESIIALLEAYPAKLSARAAVGMLEAALLFRYKTGREEDRMFDLR